VISKDLLNPREGKETHGPSLKSKDRNDKGPAVGVPLRLSKGQAEPVCQPAQGVVTKIPQTPNRPLEIPRFAVCAKIKVQFSKGCQAS